MKTQTGTAGRILAQITKHSSCTTIGLVASDLRLAHQTVKRYVTAMVREGYVEVQSDEFGDALVITDAYARHLVWEKQADRLLAKNV